MLQSRSFCVQIFQGQIFPWLILTKLVNSVLTEGLPEGQNSVAKGNVAKGIEGKRNEWEHEKQSDTGTWQDLGRIAVMSSRWSRGRVRTGVGSRGRNLRRDWIWGRTPGPRGLCCTGKWHSCRWWVVILHLSVVKAKLKRSLEGQLLHWVHQ